jgi:hypothetical protein
MFMTFSRNDPADLQPWRARLAEFGRQCNGTITARISLARDARSAATLKPCRA